MIKIKSEEEIKIIAEGGKILARIMKELETKVTSGITTSELNSIAEDLIFKSNARPAFKGYNGFPASLCTSVNEEVVHVIPSQRILKDEDIISLDLGVLYKGFFTDMAVTVAVNEEKINPETLRLMKVTKKSLKLGIKKSKISNTFGDIGNTIQRNIENRGFFVIKGLCGHGIGKEVHEDPQIPNYGKRKTGEKNKKGMVFCIEPMASLRTNRIKKSQDKYGYQTLDNSLSCHYEHTIAITEKGPRVLTSI